MPIDDYPFHIVKNPGIITASTMGLAYVPTLDGAGLTSADDASGPWLQHTTEAAAGKAGGMITTFDVVAGLWKPQAEFVVRTPTLSADLVNARFWVGLFAKLPDVLTVETTNTLLAAFIFEGGATGLARWTGVVSNGMNKLTATGSNVVTANTIYTLKIQVQDSSVVFWINGGALSPEVMLIPVSPTPPAAPELLGLGVRVTATGTSARSLLWRRASWRLS